MIGHTGMLEKLQGDQWLGLNERWKGLQGRVETGVRSYRTQKMRDLGMNFE